jgi:2-polyprenyl-3-methyl-5-hydroxy-6-metoxy-1,4-benzoquinol methylase
MDDLREKMLRRIQPWCIDNIKCGEETIDISGWMVTAEGERDKARIQCNGANPIHADMFSVRKDLTNTFPFLSEVSSAGFSCTFRAPRDTISKELIFSFGNQEMGSFQTWHNYYFPLQDTKPFPDDSGRIRVHGSDSTSAFLLEGYSTFRKLTRVMEEELGLSLSKPMKLLDWGCGCGRVSRHFDQSAIELWGADIDEPNLAWCKASLGMRTIPLCPSPPSELPAEYFDLVFGISVMTHLDDHLQDDWLAELAKCLKPNGLLLLSCHGVASALRGFSKRQFKHFLVNGFIDLGENEILQETVPESSHYRDTYNSPGHIASNWCGDFQIQCFHEAIVGNHQDLVVLRKP